MALSEHEQQVIAELERSLLEDTSYVQPPAAKPKQSNTKVSLVLFGMVIGCSVMLLGIINEAVLVGAAGFAIMLTALSWGLAKRNQPAVAEVAETFSHGYEKDFTSTNSFEQATSFMSRIEDRWNRRQDEQQPQTD